jgi:tRNA-modifying protein YgfZ
MTQAMNEWMQHLALHGARMADGADHEVADFGHGLNVATLQAGFVAPLTDLGLIAANGDDTSHFLHGQLTNDVEHLAATQAQLAGYCSAKGRLLATLLMWRSNDTILLQVPRTILATLQKRLQMFVLRAKVKLADVSDQQVQLGLGGKAASAAMQNWFPVLPATPYAKVENDHGTLIRVADAFGATRYIWIASLDTAKNAWPDLVRLLTPAGTESWRLAAIQAGVPQVTAATQEQFVPQMINFELIGGVNFRKGCYPGQEIVARSQYLGKLKRRMMLASVEMADGIPAAGMEVYSSADPSQPCGMVVNAARHDGVRFDCLVELKIAAATDGEVRLGTADGPVLRFGELPYALPADSTPD